MGRCGKQEDCKQREQRRETKERARHVRKIIMKYRERERGKQKGGVTGSHIGNLKLLLHLIYNSHIFCF